jgi:hypothetical protein
MLGVGLAQDLREVNDRNLKSVLVLDRIAPVHVHHSRVRCRLLGEKTPKADKWHS